MASVESFKPAMKQITNKTKLPKKPAVPLTDEQYEEIFNAAINPFQKGLKLKVPLKADLPGNEAKSPTESAITKANIRSYTFDKKKLKTTESLEHESDSEPESLNSSITGPPRKLTKRERLQWLQDRRGEGMYVKCDDKNCAKWRWLDNPDPVDLPPKWFCYMNPDKSLAACFVPESKISKVVENDLVHNVYSPGSIVWAKMAGYPWWPAMVDDCPDCEQYYWINNNGHLVPNYYNVVFFDNTEVTRRWILVQNLKSYKHNMNFDINFKLPRIYKKRMRLAKEKANAALELHIIDRLKLHSFLALWDKEIPEFLTSSDEGDDSDIVDEAGYEERIKKKIIQRKRAHNNKYKNYKKRRNSTNRDQVELSQYYSDGSVISKLIAYNKNKMYKTATKKLKKNIKTGKPTKKVKNLSERGERIPNSQISIEDKQGLPQEKNKVKEISNRSSKPVAESKLKIKTNEKGKDTTEDKRPQEKGKDKENLNKDSPKTLAESKLKKKSIEKSTEIETTDNKQSLFQAKNKGKENISRDSTETVTESKLKIKSETTVNDSGSSKSSQIFRPVDRLLEGCKVGFDRDLAQKAYDLCLDLFTSGSDGEILFKAMYKIITSSNNNTETSQITVTSEEPDESSKETIKNEEEINEPDKDQNENTPKIKLFEKLHKQTILLQSRGEKRKIEESLSKMVKIIKMAQQAHITTNQNASICTVSSASDVPQNIFEVKEEISTISK